MTNKEIHNALVAWVASVTNVVTIKAHQSGPRPALPYVMVDLTDIAPLEGFTPHVDYIETDDLNAEGEKNVSATPKLKQEWRFQVQAYGTEPTGILRPLRAAWNLPQLTEQLRPYIINETTKISDVPEMVESEWESRAVTSIFLHGYPDDTFIVDVIDEFTFQQIET